MERTKIKFKNVSIIAVLTCIFAVEVASATTVNIAVSDDVWVITRYPDANLVSYTEMRVGPRANEGINRSIVKFDLSSIPAGSVITSVKLYVYALAAAENTTDFYDVYVASGTGVTTWDDATATWNNTQTNWTYTLAENDDDVFVTAAGPVSWNITTSLSAGDVVTFGILSKIETSDTNQRLRLYTTRYANESMYPYLEVTYEAIPEPVTISLLGIGSIGLLFYKRLSHI